MTCVINRACSSYLVVLKKFVSKCVHEKFPQVCLCCLINCSLLLLCGDAQEEKAFPELGHYLSVLVPRCSDSSVTLRQTAAENIQALLCMFSLLCDRLIRFPHRYQPNSEQPRQPEAGTRD